MQESYETYRYASHMGKMRIR